MAWRLLQPDLEKKTLENTRKWKVWTKKPLTHPFFVGMLWSIQGKKGETFSMPTLKNAEEYLIEFKQNQEEESIVENGENTHEALDSRLRDPSTLS